MQKKANIVLFDYDGTLSAGDVSLGFWKYCFGHSVRPWLFLPVILCGIVVQMAAFISRFVVGCKNYNVRHIDILWRQMARCFLTPEMVKKLAPAFISQFKQNQFGWGPEQVAKERESGNIAIMTTAGPSYLLLPLAQDMGFDYMICSEMEPSRPWCFRYFNYGENKVESLRALFVPKQFGVVHSYSDSKSDLPMMQIAREQVWINPKTGCRKN